MLIRAAVALVFGVVTAFWSSPSVEVLAWAMGLYLLATSAAVWMWRLSFGALFPTTCKYHPSCSQYAIDAVRAKGLVRGSALAGWRLLRCNPWSRGGFDPVR